MSFSVIPTGPSARNDRKYRFWAMSICTATSHKPGVSVERIELQGSNQRGFGLIGLLIPERDVGFEQIRPSQFGVLLLQLLRYRQRVGIFFLQ